MKLALLSDLHANWQAFEACRQHALAQGVDQWVVLGDLVGYGADPKPVLEAVMAMQDQGAWVLRGNHDEMAVRPPVQESLGASTAQWTQWQLTRSHLDFLAGLPLQHQFEHRLFVHASARQPEQWRYVDDVREASLCLEAAAPLQARHVYVGHVHRQVLYYQGAGRQLMAFDPTPGVPVPLPRHRAWVASVGSVGQPRDGDPRAMYALIDTQAAQLVFHRVRYDHVAAAQAIRRAGLPEFFAQRLEVGR